MSEEALPSRQNQKELVSDLVSAFDAGFSPIRFAKVMTVTVLATAIPPLLSACSVGMAMSGEEDPNVEYIQIGSDRLDVERELGAPHGSALVGEGRLEAVYRYELGNEPAPARAVMHGVLDVLTMGIWEVVGTPIEGFQGTKYEATIVYDAEGKVESLNTIKLDEKPEPAPEERPQVADVKRWIDENGSLLERRLNEFWRLEKAEISSTRVRVISHEVVEERGDRFLLQVEFQNFNADSSEPNKVEMFLVAFDNQGVRFVYILEG